MSVWLTIPSARSAAEVEPVLAEWRRMGYKIALWRDTVEFPSGMVDYLRVGKYPGYAQAVNALVFDVLKYQDPACDWIVAAGDDTLPDPNKTADEIAAECSEHFYKSEFAHNDLGAAIVREHSTFGVMQPTGDRFAGGSIDRIAGSAWIGREWCLRINQGKGPLWPDYTHMFVDEELQCVAEKYGVFWQRPDLVHLHRHFMRESDALDSRAVKRDVPAHLIEANSPGHWNKFKTLFAERKAAGFQGSEPL